MSLKQQVMETVVKAFGKTADVTGKRLLSPHLLQLRLSSPLLKKLEWKPGHKIKFCISDGSTRSYTPSRWDHHEGWMEVIVHLHGKGAASQWAAELKPGDTVSFVGPAKSLALEAPSLEWAWFFGEETTVGLAQALTDTLPASTETHIALELDKADIQASETAGFSFTALPRQETHGPALLEHLNSLNIPEGNGLIWLSGEAGSVLELRRALLNRGVARSQMRIKPYWSVRGKAHRKKLEKGELRS